jgi:hypothetical protein
MFTIFAFFLTIGLSSENPRSTQDENRARNALSPTEDYIHSLTLNEDKKYKVFWKFDNETITFEVHVETLGWVGFGLSPGGGMRGSDVVIGWVKDGKPYLSVSMTSHLRDVLSSASLPSHCNFVFALFHTANCLEISGQSETCKSKIVRRRKLQQILNK